MVKRTFDATPALSIEQTLHTGLTVYELINRQLAATSSNFIMLRRIDHFQNKDGKETSFFFNISAPLKH